MPSSIIQRLSSTWCDAGGITHDPDAAARHKRIVSLVPSLTETLCAVGGRERLIGCTAFCTRPTGLRKAAGVTVVGGTKTIKREKLLALEPDLVLMNLEENTLEDIAFLKTRLECYVNGVKNLEQGIQTLNELGSLIDEADTAERLAHEAVEVLNKIKPGSLSRPRIFYAIWKDPWMSINRDTFIHNHLTSCGAENVFAERGERYPVVTLDDIAATRPDAIWLPSEPYRFVERHGVELRNLLGDSVAQKIRIDLVDGDAVCWFGARQIEGMLYTHQQVLNAASFKDECGTGVRIGS